MEDQFWLGAKESNGCLSFWGHETSSLLQSVATMLRTHCADPAVSAQQALKKPSTCHQGPDCIVADVRKSQTPVMLCCLAITCNSAVFLRQSAMVASMLVRDCLMQNRSATLSCCQQRGNCEHPSVAAADERDACALFLHMFQLLDTCRSGCRSEHGPSCACRSTSSSQAMNRHLSYRCSLAAHPCRALGAYRAPATGNIWQVAKLAASVVYCSHVDSAQSSCEVQCSGCYA